MRCNRRPRRLWAAAGERYRKTSLRATMEKRTISVGRYVEALQASLDRGVAASVRQMLAAHASSPGRIATFRSLGSAVGFSQPNTNRIYGQFAGRMRRQLGLPKPEVEILAIATAPAPPIDAAGEFSFRMRPEFAKALMILGLTSTPRRVQRRTPSSEGTPPHIDELYEGAIRRSQITGWERSREARRQCIAHFGAKCQACGFEFARRYGSLGTNFIEVHHTTVFAARQGRRRVDPLVDLAPVCSNCHRMLHRRQPPLGIRDLRRRLGRDV